MSVRWRQARKRGHNGTPKPGSSLQRLRATGVGCTAAGITSPLLYCETETSNICWMFIRRLALRGPDTRRVRDCRKRTVGTTEVTPDAISCARHRVTRRKGARRISGRVDRERLE